MNKKAQKKNVVFYDNPNVEDIDIEDEDFEFIDKDVPLENNTYIRGVQVVPEHLRRSKDILYKYEMISLINKYIPYIETTTMPIETFGHTTARDIAIEHLHRKIIPYKLLRSTIDNRKELWLLDELRIIHSITTDMIPVEL
jgi:hypothetical protein